VEFRRHGNPASGRRHPCDRYAFAFPGGQQADPTNQNTTMQPEAIKLPNGVTELVSVSDRVLVADAILSTGASLPAMPTRKQLHDD